MMTVKNQFIYHSFVIFIDLDNHEDVDFSFGIPALNSVSSCTLKLVSTVDFEKNYM